jgi:transcriptional regulator with XRE-family HTH domain
MWPDLAINGASGLVSLPAMDTNGRLRKRAARLVNAGVSQKVLAAKMGMTPSTFSKWLNQKGGIGPASVVSLDGLNEYAKELATAALTEENLQEPRANKGGGQRKKEQAG